MKAYKKEVPDLLHCILNTLEVCISLMVCEGEVDTVDMTDEESRGYYLVKQLRSELYILQEDSGGMYCHRDHGG